MRWRAWASTGALLGCASAGDEPEGGAASAPSRYAEGRVPVPGCESFDYGRCDIREAACIDNVAAIARCLRGGDATLPAPAVTFMSEAEAERELLQLLPAATAEGVNHFEVALTRLGLTKPGALGPAEMAGRYAREWAAYYSHGRRAIIVIEHAAPLDPLSENVILLHEMIHALQDAEHDLDAFNERYGQGIDANLRASSVVEGEARLHERRYLAARLGLDSTEIDFERSFANLQVMSERRLFEQDDLYSASLLGVPYAHGAAYVFDVWSEGGHAGVRSLFDAPPSTMRHLLASLWGGDPSVALSPLEPVAPVELPTEWGQGSGGAVLEAWTSMGAWGLYLLARPRASGIEAAQRLALGWRGDMLEVFSLGTLETAARWQLELSAEADASWLADMLTDAEGVTATRAATRVTLMVAPETSL